MCLTGSGTISILKQRESKKSLFEIVFKSLARFGTQFRVKEVLRRNPIEDGAISGFSGQKSVPE